MEGDKGRRDKFRLTRPTMRIASSVFVVNSPLSAAKRRKAIYIFDETEKLTFLRTGHLHPNEEQKESYIVVQEPVDAQLLG